MESNKKSGILLHPTSLPSKSGIGELGSEAYKFIDFLRKSGQSLWQILPLGPVGYGESPYQCFSAFAGNPMLISIEKLLEAGLLEQADVDSSMSFNAERIDFERVKAYKNILFRKAFNAFRQKIKPADMELFEADNYNWLHEFAFFMAIKEHFGGVAWNQWDRDIAAREKSAMERYNAMLTDEVEYNKFLQYMFFKQWLQLKKYANYRGITIIGDLPLFISSDSSDAWARPELFELDDEGRPLKVAGVPPDYFSETGQYWGNPHYRWEVMEKDGFRWWQDRFTVLLELVDIIRVDHFRGFESYWEIYGSEKTAQNGRWVTAPGRKLFETIRKYMKDIPIIAEDLGFITKEVDELKNEFGFPGMKILQFTFGKGSEERFLPHNYEENAVVYTGTHDNDTTLGWYLKTKENDPEAIENLKKYYGLDEDIKDEDICWIFIETAYKSNANTAVIPLQDILGLGSEARMNIPSTIGSWNWSWRFKEGALTGELAAKLKDLSLKYGRNNVL